MKLVQYIKDTKGELKHVNWPTKSQAINYTVLVISISIVTALFLSMFDYIFSRLISFII